MPWTTTFAVNSAGFTTITVNTPCRRVEIYENDLTGTADYLLACPPGSATPVTQPAGTAKIFTQAGGFRVGDTPGAVKASTGSMTFAQVEYDE